MFASLTSVSPLHKTLFPVLMVAVMPTFGTNFNTFEKLESQSETLLLKMNLKNFGVL